jgi:exodeoxyribonuclease VII large subunit
MFEAYSVATLTVLVKNRIESDPELQDIWVEGEVSNMTRASSGHWYFTLKDSASQIKCVVWRSSAERQQTRPENGHALMAHGYVSVYESRGEYQLIADRVRPVGVGDLYLRFEQLKAQLEEEGLFDDSRKRPIPYFPQKIGIVTSAEAAAFQDVQNVLRQRFPMAQVILASCLVQGTEAPPQIVAAIERLNRYTDVDVILVIRGGGSIEDLWAFNEEQVARAIAASRIPIVSGVGHETDFTIADFVADLRAPTPSAAAMAVSPDRKELRLNIQRVSLMLDEKMNASLENRRDALDDAGRVLRRVSPIGRIATLRQRVDDWNGRLASLERGRLALLRERLAGRQTALNAANPQAMLARGYAIVYHSEDGKQLSSAQGVKPGTGITIKLRDGELKGRIEDSETHERYKRTLF